MKAFKKATSTILASAALLGGLSFATAANAAVVEDNMVGKSFVVDNVQYNIYSNSFGVRYAVVNAYFASEPSTLDVPETVTDQSNQEYDVRYVGTGTAPIFGADKVTALTVHGAINIADNALSRADNLTSVDLSAAYYLSIGKEAFAYDHALASLKLPADTSAHHHGVYIEEKAFCETFRNSEVVFPIMAEHSSYTIADTATADSGIHFIKG